MTPNSFSFLWNSTPKIQYDKFRCQADDTLVYTLRIITSFGTFLCKMIKSSWSNFQNFHLFQSLVIVTGCIIYTSETADRLFVCCIYAGKLNSAQECLCALAFDHLYCQPARTIPSIVFGLCQVALPQAIWVHSLWIRVIISRNQSQLAVCEWPCSEG